MKRHSRVSIFLLAACFFGAVVCVPASVCAEEESSPYNVPKGVYLDMDKDFYKALSNTQGGTKVHTTDASLVYLRMILKNQEEIMKKLDLLLDKKK
jgi:hypothetical protein